MKGHGTETQVLSSGLRIHLMMKTTVTINHEQEKKKFQMPPGSLMFETIGIFIIVYWGLMLYFELLNNLLVFIPIIIGLCLWLLSAWRMRKLIIINSQ
jgi:hypothetical protein